MGLKWLPAEGGVTGVASALNGVAPNKSTSSTDKYISQINSFGTQHQFFFDI